MPEFGKPGVPPVGPSQKQRRSGGSPGILLVILGSIATVVFLLAVVRSADAFALGMAGADGVGLLRNRASTLYASDRDGRVVPLARVGSALAGGVVIDLGIPDMMPDGRVLFAAQTETAFGLRLWRVYMGNPNLPHQNRVRLALKSGAGTANCSPVFKVDPYPVVGPDGEIALVAAEASGGDAVFLYTHDRWSCLAHTGDRTDHGHVISLLGFGSQQAGRHGQVVITAWLRPSKGSREILDDAPAILMASAGSETRELASAIGVPRQFPWRYRAFGLPAAMPLKHDTLVAFVAKTSSGKGLFLYRNGLVTLVTSTGTLTRSGRVSYLSLGRPGLMADGTTAVLAAVGGIPTLLQVVRGHMQMRARRPIKGPSGIPLQWFGDPALVASGAMFFGAEELSGREGVYIIDEDGNLFEAGNSSMVHEINDRSSFDHSAFTGSLSVNQRGDFTYLGGN
jgi:hypothetical protein